MKIKASTTEYIQHVKELLEFKHEQQATTIRAKSDANPRSATGLVLAGRGAFDLGVSELIAEAIRLDLGIQVRCASLSGLTGIGAAAAATPDEHPDIIAVAVTPAQARSSAASREAVISAVPTRHRLLGRAGRAGRAPATSRLRRSLLCRFGDLAHQSRWQDCGRTNSDSRDSSPASGAREYLILLNCRSRRRGSNGPRRRLPVLTTTAANDAPAASRPMPLRSGRQPSLSGRRDGSHLRRD